jgi:hypothetical protein
MNIEKIIEYILKQGNKYPGKHSSPTERTNPSQKPLEPKSQMLIIWRALITYLDNNLRKGVSVNIKKFGSFTFDISTDLPRIASRNIHAASDIGRDRNERKNIHKCRPCFMVDPAIGTHLIRYNNKEEVTPAGSQKSVYQKGFRSIYCNPVPIASACQMGVDVVRDCLDTIWKAIEDLINIHDKDIALQLGFAVVIMRNKNLRVQFADYLTKDVTATEFETKMKRMTSPVSSLWKTNTDKMFKTSALGTMIKKPNLAVTEALAQKT